MFLTPIRFPETNYIPVNSNIGLKARYGQDDVSEEFITSLEEFEYDYSITSFEDILNLPNLEKLILGKNRYLQADMADQVPQSELYDLERSLSFWM